VQHLDRARYARDERLRARQRQQAQQWRVRNPEKVRAERVVDREVRAGRLVRQPCEVCGQPAHAHHADYRQPLAVQWLCPLHHARQHAMEGRLA